MKKSLIYICLILILPGCNNLRSNVNPPTQTEQLCSELKRNIIFNTASMPNIDKSSATQQAQMLHLYDKYDCKALEKRSN